MHMIPCYRSILSATDLMYDYEGYGFEGEYEWIEAWVYTL